MDHAQCTWRHPELITKDIQCPYYHIHISACMQHMYACMHCIFACIGNGAGGHRPGPLPFPQFHVPVGM